MDTVARTYASFKSPTRDCISVRRVSDDRTILITPTTRLGRPVTVWYSDSLHDLCRVFTMRQGLDVARRALTGRTGPRTEPNDTAAAVLAALGLSPGDVLCPFHLNDGLNPGGKPCLMKNRHDGWHQGLGWSAMSGSLR